MKKRLLVVAMLLSACSQLPDERKAEVETLAVPAEEIKPSEPEEYHCFRRSGADVDCGAASAMGQRTATSLV